MLKKTFIIVVVGILLIFNVKAEERTDFIDDAKILINDKTINELNDNNYKTFISINVEDIITIKSPVSVKAIYIIYYKNSGQGIIKYNNKETNIGLNNFLHEFVELSESSDELNIIFNQQVTIKEIFLFDDEIPNWVQQWEIPHQDSDMILFSTHSDDEHLFFAGLIPTMIANSKKIQVVYITNHNDNPIRLDEQLNGLWAVGLRNYPILGIVPDAYSTTLNGAIDNLNKANLNIDDVIRFEAEMIRRFKPEVIVGHDENGEYGHGQHIMNTYALKEALKISNSAEFTSNYEPFMPYKVYLHLYPDNKITMDYDTILDYYGGLTAYQVSKLGYKEHNSQQYTWFTKWLNGNNNEFTKAVQISTYSPLDFGLYYSSVGYENVDGDMFYNIPSNIKNDDIENKNDLSEADIKEIVVFDKLEKNNHNYKSYLIVIISISLILVIIITLLYHRKKH